jgi:hypothetical protein
MGGPAAGGERKGAGEIGGMGVVIVGGSARLMLKGKRGRGRLR